MLIEISEVNFTRHYTGGTCNKLQMLTRLSSDDYLDNT
jgi:hypothetical protein